MHARIRVHMHVGNSGVHAHVQAHALAYTHRQLWASRFCPGTPAPQGPATCQAEAARWLPLGSQRLESEGWAPSRQAGLGHLQGTTDRCHRLQACRHSLLIFFIPKTMCLC